MFAPTKTWRKWHRKINVNQRRYATVAAIAATAVPALVMARGHKVDNVPEIPLVLPTSVESTQKTKEAIQILKDNGAFADVERVKASKTLRRGKGKMRNRRFTQRRGPLIVYAEDNGITRAFRNLPGVELCNVTRLNLLQLAPGAHLGRFVIWTAAAVAQLDAIYGTSERNSSQQKKGYQLPRHIMNTSDLARIINSDQVQSVLRPKVARPVPHAKKKNALKNRDVMLKLNPFFAATRKREEERRAAKKTAKTRAKRDEKSKAAGKAYWAMMMAESSSEEDSSDEE